MIKSIKYEELNALQSNLKLNSNSNTTSDSKTKSNP